MVNIYTTVNEDLIIKESVCSPLVSIYVPTHNRPDFLIRALESLVLQTYKNIEVLVCDDGSSSDLKYIRDSFCKKFPYFCWVESSEPRGACVSRNELIQRATGEYITGLDDDDEFLPNRVECFIKAPELSQYSFLCSRNETNTGEKTFIGSRFYGSVALDDMFNGNVVGNQIFIKTSSLRYVGGFDESFPSWQDYDTWFRLIDTFGSAFKLKEPSYKLNIGHEMGRITKSEKAKLGFLKFIEKHGEKLPEKSKNTLKIVDLINRNEKISLMNTLSVLNGRSFFLICRYFLKKVYLLI
ncbi:glycosyltransferase [Amphritea opalescens]|nr:glycosyltransferase [Amphritea opalescens]